MTLFLGSIRARDQCVVMTYSSPGELCRRSQVEFRWKKSVEPGPVVKRSVGDPLVAVAHGPCFMEREVLPQSES